jgi:phosphoribosyl-dephospho-CoA transferase
MTSLLDRSNPIPRRHDLVFVSPAAWRSLVKRRDDLAGEPLVAGWVDCGWPLIARRHAADEAGGLALGLPLPPSFGKRRFSALMRPDAISSHTPPPSLRAAIGVAPECWRPSLEQVVALAEGYSMEARVFGSLAWRLLTGLDYLTAGSDLDILLPLSPGVDVARLIAELAEIDAGAPMRLDGELLRDDGAGVNWREFRSGAQELLVKTGTGLALLQKSEFLSGGIRP